MADRTAFLTGGTGFLGRNIAEQLVKDGWQVMALARSSADTQALRDMDVAIAEGDLTDAGSVLEAMPEGCDAVFHAAAMTSVWKRQADEQRAINVGGTGNVVEAALAKKAGRLIHTSTWNVYDWTGGVIDETTPKSGRDSWINYNRTKHEAEDVVLEAVAGRGLEAVILNPSHILGRYDTSNWARLVTMAALGRLPGVPPGAGDFAHGVAVAKAHIAAVDKGRSGENYLLGGPHARFLELVQLVAKTAHQDRVPRMPTPAFMLRTMARVEEGAAAFTGRQPQVTPEAVEMVCADVTIRSTRAQDELGYEPSSLEKAVEDSYGWLIRAKILRS
ncbi:MAG: NAD-dependent epimerase/dehydratase family protein [Minwuia sp.]|uniref:NAD-dependent epimerase/dehydratase family protein n=1 Tax=Minwuia sp. TaxID=2493630 RepID=UPI003A88ABE0